MSVIVTGDPLQARLHTPGAFLMPGEVAILFRVDPKTVSRWCLDGRLACIVTPGGHRRIPAEAVLTLLNPSHG